MFSACSSDSGVHAGDGSDAQASAGAGAGARQGTAGSTSPGTGGAGSVTDGGVPDASLSSDGGAGGSSGGGGGAIGTNTGGGRSGPGGAPSGSDRSSGGTSGNDGGVSAGGTNAGGASYGGVSNGGVSNGGASYGGVSNGGASYGGVSGATGGSANGNGGTSGATGGGANGNGSGGAPDDADAGPCKPLTLKLLNATELDSPGYATAPPGDSRLFVLERAAGRISILDATGKKVSTYLDISKTFNADGFEAGVLALAFHPGFATNGAFYVTYTTANTLRVSRFTASSAAATTVDAASESVVIETPQDSHHNTGGALHFGPDGMLYVAIGDADTEANGQDPTVITGKMLRLSVNPTATGYTIPADNPFTSSATARHEIWALGLREPYRFWFDPGSKDLFIADVGDSSHEEIDVVPAAQAGLNFGWPIMEGTYCHTPATGCSKTGLTLPVYDYPHTGGESAIIGASVYRGTALSACYRGSYVFGDYPSGRIDTLRFDGSAAVVAPIAGLGDPNLVSFGEDGNGEIVVVNYDQSVYRVVTD